MSKIAGSGTTTTCLRLEKRSTVVNCCFLCYILALLLLAEGALRVKKPIILDSRLQYPSQPAAREQTNQSRRLANLRRIAADRNASRHISYLSTFTRSQIPNMMMEDEDDDFYDPADAVPVTQRQNGSQHPPADSGPQDSNDAEEEEIEVEEDEVCAWTAKISYYCLLLSPRMTSISSPKHLQMRPLQKCKFTTSVQHTAPC